MEELTFKVFNNRRSEIVTYRVNKTDSGWYIAHVAINGDCEPDGSPCFYSNFDQDYINYPSGFASSLEWLWEQIDSKKINHEEAQNKLQELADWVSLCEKEQPNWKGWNI